MISWLVFKDAVFMKKLAIAKFGFIILLTLFPTLCFSDKQATISIIFSSDITPYQQTWQGFKEFFEESKVSLRTSKHNLKHQDPQVICSQIQEKKPELILTLGGEASELIKKEIKNIPVVFSMVLNPNNFLSSNITGVSLNISMEEKLKKIKSIFPDVKRIGIIYSPENTFLYEEALKACNKLNYQLIRKKINSVQELPKILKEISWQIDCFLITPDSKIYFNKSIEYLLMESLKRGFLVIGLSSYYTRAGAPISFDCDYKDLGKQTAEIALKILEGKKPTDILPSGPRKIIFSLNLLTVNKLGLKIPKAIIEEANEVFDK
ncbi:MAG: ABC transporter substrate-binding protein [bacterium]|nr:ABC transporter substrate-binding protein [bacterium]